MYLLAPGASVPNRPGGQGLRVGDGSAGKLGRKLIAQRAVPPSGDQVAGEGGAPGTPETSSGRRCLGARLAELSSLEQG